MRERLFHYRKEIIQMAGAGIVVAGVAGGLSWWMDPSRQCDPGLGYQAVANAHGKSYGEAFYAAGIRHIEVRVPSPEFRIYGERYASQIQSTVKDSQLDISVSVPPKFQSHDKTGDLVKRSDCRFLIVYSPNGV